MFLKILYIRDKTKKELMEEIDFLHSGLMALEKIVVSKGLISIEKLNILIKEAYDECKENRSKGKKPIMK